MALGTVTIKSNLLPDLTIRPLEPSGKQSFFIKLIQPEVAVEGVAGSVAPAGSPAHRYLFPVLVVLVIGGLSYVAYRIYKALT